MPPGMHPFVRHIVIFCLQHWVYFILFKSKMQGKLFSHTKIPVNFTTTTNTASYLSVPHSPVIETSLGFDLLSLQRSSQNLYKS